MENNSNASMTRLMHKMATSRSMSIAEAAEALRQESGMRLIREVIGQIMGISPDDKKALQSRLLDVMLENEPLTNRENLAHSIHNWLGDSSYRINRASSLRIALALHLDAETAEHLLVRTCGEGFHWRDPRDIVYLFALGQDMNYTQLQELTQSLQEKGLLAKKPSAGDPSAFTDQVNYHAAQLGSESELEDFLRIWGGHLGSYHNTAYELFMTFLDNMGWKDRLGEPGKNSASEKKEKDPMKDKTLFMSQVFDTYMHGSQVNPPVPEDGQPAVDVNFTPLQNHIRALWPNEQTLSKMVHRKTDVTRKVMVLLFLATNGGSSDYGDLPYDVPAEDLFEDMYVRLDTMLVSCGFAPLDPRSKFDWMIIYCMCTSDVFRIDGRLQHFLAEIFPELPKPEIIWDGYDD